MQSTTSLVAMGIAALVLGCAGVREVPLVPDTPSEVTPGESPPVEEEVGFDGARLEIPGVAIVEIRANSVPAAVKVQLSVAEPPLAFPVDRASALISLSPHGTTFSLPARVTLYYDRDSPSSLRVFRLVNDASGAWIPVGGVRFDGTTAVFETMAFGYFAVGATASACVSPYSPVPCSDGCNCCGGTSCVSFDTAAHCGGCAVSCSLDQFCSSSSTCASVKASRLCENADLVVIHGELPEGAIVAYEQTTDGLYAGQIASLIASQCQLQPRHLSQATDGILDPCSDEPLVGGGTTLLVVGGDYGQRVARFLDRNLAPVYLDVDETDDTHRFRSREGTVLATFQRSAETDHHDYFVISQMAEHHRGALILYIYGIGWEGTPAATWYFTNRVYPEMVAGTRSWSRYLLVEWTDANGNITKDDADTWTVLAKDVP